MHIRQKIRNEIVAAVTGLTTTGSRVYPSRVWPLDDDTIPGLLVYTGDEDVDSEEGRVARVQNRDLQIVVIGKAKLTAGLDDLLDDIAEEVETAVLSASYATIQSIDLLSTEIDIERGAEKPTGEVILTFSVHYLTRDGQPNITF